MLGFRVWDFDEKRMLDLDSDNDIHGLASDPQGHLVYADLSENLEDGILTEAESFGSYIPMQSTGVKDVNGVEIFEGDLIRVQHSLDPHGNDFSYKSMEITPYWVENVTSFLRWIGSIEPIEVIHIEGNRFENPELLEKTAC